MLPCLDRLAVLGTLAASIVHEIRQPLAAILIETYSMQRWMNREVPDTAEVDEGLRRIQALSERVEQIIRSLQALLRQKCAESAPFSLADAVHEMVGHLDGRLQDAGVTLTLDIDGSLPLFMGDRVQLQQVVSNLMLNALDAVQARAHGAPAIVVRLQCEHDAYVRIEVIDNGEGISAEQACQMFEPLASTKVGGMGIGLAISRMIVEAHGGTIAAVSQQGRTSVGARLPLPRADRR